MSDFKIGQICILVNMASRGPTAARFEGEECEIVSEFKVFDCMDLDLRKQVRGWGYQIRLLRDGLELVMSRNHLKPKRDDDQWAKDRVADLLKTLNVKLPDGFKIQEKEHAHE